MKRVSGCAIIENNKLLLLKKIKHNFYEFPGGKIDEGETEEETAIRETIEEIGVEPLILENFWKGEFQVKDKKLVGTIFLARLPDKSTPKIMEPDAFNDIKWIDLNEIKNYPLAPNVKLFLEKYIRT